MYHSRFFQLFNKLEVYSNSTCLLLAKRNRGGYTLYNTIRAREEALEKVENARGFRKPDVIEQMARSLPKSLKYFTNEKNIKCIEKKPEENLEPILETSVQFPFQNVHTLPTLEKQIVVEDSTKDVYEVMKLRNELIKEKKNWMLNYENFEDTSLDSKKVVINGEINYGTPDPKCKISHVPCGGCGAHLHCKDPSLPGYIPSEIFKNSKKEGGAILEAVICQRCYFLKNHNVALEVQVSDTDYPEVLKTISARKGVVVLMVDLTDFPCSIWPGIADIFHKMPIIVVGNKVDLLPKDSQKYLEHVRRTLQNCVRAYGFGGCFLIDVLLVSATTGYGVEDLIIKIQKSWKYKGDVYLVGCTNVGKSSLFNTLIQSDCCKSQAEDLIQRATTSVWPGTTLNLLKFPLSKPGGLKLELRLKRLKELKRMERSEEEDREKLLKETNDWKHAVLRGRIDRSSSKNTDIGDRDLFSIRVSNDSTGRTELGLDEKDPLYAHSRWCYDTPGVVQPEQILNLLTAEELCLTLPKSLIEPRTFCIRPGDSLFIAGLARLDFLEGTDSIWFTVFASEELPISLCETANADEFYKKFLGTKYLRVPSGGPERLKKWPGLSQAKTFTVDGVDYDFSSKDVVLSNAGWISITGRRGRTMKLSAWTPDGKGVHLRDCILPQAINFKGTRVRSTPAYKKHRYFSKETLWY